VADEVLTSRDGAVLTITLNRPEVYNAFNRELHAALQEALTAAQDPAIRCVVVTGAGKGFCAGQDLKEFGAVSASIRDALEQTYHPNVRLVRALEKPVIAAVNGLAAGGGFELALACDLIVAERHAEFFLPEVNLGFVPDAGGVLRLPRRLPRAIAMEMLLTGRRMGAEEAFRWGLVNRVVDAGAALDAARELAASIDAAAPLAIRAVKAVVSATEHLDAESAYAHLRDGGISAYVRMLESEDADEGPRAFAEGRSPVWKGR
jgi:crotonobetainyl-CoA hydratase